LHEMEEWVEHLAEVLLDLFVLLLATKIGDELFKRIGQPPLIGEILAGIFVGPAVLGWYSISPETQLFAEIGVVLILFQVGVETRLGDLVRIGPTAAAVGLFGVALPLAAGLGMGLVLGAPMEVAVFLAAALTATSVGITARALADLGALTSVTGRAILGAAVLDDVLAMLILALATGLIAGEASLIDLVTLLLLAGAFVAVVAIGGTGLLRRRPALLTEPKFAETPFLPGMIMMLGLAALSATIGLAALIGAFLAGLVAGESSERRALEHEVAPLAALFSPFFFGFVGANVSLESLTDARSLAILLALTALAILTKFVGAGLGAIRLGRRRAAAVGWGMVPRGEVGIAIAGIGFASGAIDAGIYAAVVGMAVLTTVVVPPFLGNLVRAAEPADIASVTD